MQNNDAEAQRSCARGGDSNRAVSLQKLQVFTKNWSFQKVSENPHRARTCKPFIQNRLWEFCLKLNVESICHGASLTPNDNINGICVFELRGVEEKLHVFQIYRKCLENLQKLYGFKLNFFCGWTFWRKTPESFCKTFFEILNFCNFYRKFL